MICALPPLSRRRLLGRPNGVVRCRRGDDCELFGVADVDLVGIGGWLVDAPKAHAVRAGTQVDRCAGSSTHAEPGTLYPLATTRTQERTPHKCVHITRAASYRTDKRASIKVPARYELERQNIYRWCRVTRLLIDIDDQLRDRAAREIGTSGVSDTVRTALRQAASAAARARQISWLADGRLAEMTDVKRRADVWL